MSRGQLARLFSRLFGDKTAVVSDALRRFQNANDAAPPNAQNVTSRKSCEVPSCPSFPQVPKERPASSNIEFLVVRASAGRSPLAPRSFVNAGVNRRRPPAYTGALFICRAPEQTSAWGCASRLGSYVRAAREDVRRVAETLKAPYEDFNGEAFLIVPG